MSKNLKILMISFLLGIVMYMVIESYSENNKKKAIISERLERLTKFDYEKVQLENLESLNQINNEIIEKATKEATKHKVIFAGITRDNFDDIFVAIKHIEHIGDFFADYRVIIFENDSVDGTKELLEKWSNLNKKVKIISQDFAFKKRPSHKFMAEIRNQYLKPIFTSDYEDFDLLVILDLDITYGIDVRGIFDSLSKFDQWDVVCANGVAGKNGRMFDAFAFRSKEFPFSPSEWQEICVSDSSSWKKICKNGDNFSRGIFYDLFSFRDDWREVSRLYWLKIIPQIQKKYSVNSDLVEVNSCFGGLAIYKKVIINNCFYNSIENDCEHVDFHHCLKEKKHARIFLNPNMVLRYSHYK